MRFWSKIDSFELSATKVAVSGDQRGTFVAECEHRPIIDRTISQ